MRFQKQILIISLLALAFVGCEQHVSPHHTKARGEMHTYRHQQDDGSWLYWYILYANNSTYYYSSPTRVTDFGTTPFTSTGGKSLPAEVNEEVQQSEEVSAQSIEASQEPAIAEAEANMDGGMDAASTDSGGSSGGDSGGAGDSGGGGGE